MKQETKPCVAPCAQCRCGTSGTGETGGTQTPTSHTAPTSPTSPTSPTTADRIADSLGRIADALEALVTTAKEKENLPPTPPIREKEVQQVPPRARTCEENLTCEGVLIPTLEEVKEAAPGIGVDAETAEDFWNFFYGLGWKYKGDTIRKWRPMLKAWKNTRSRLERRDEKLIAHFDARAERRQAHIDAKMDEREAKRASRPSASGRRKADNWVGSTEEQRKGLEDAFRV